MVDQVPAPAGGASASAAATNFSLSQTTTVALGSGSGLVLAEYLVKPVWPPPPAVLAILVAMLAPAVHLIGRGIMRGLAKWAGEQPAPAPAGAPATLTGEPT